MNIEQELPILLLRIHQKRIDTEKSKIFDKRLQARQIQMKWLFVCFATQTSQQKQKRIVRDRELLKLKKAKCARFQQFLELLALSPLNYRGHTVVQKSL